MYIEFLNTLCIYIYIVLLTSIPSLKHYTTVNPFLCDTILTPLNGSVLLPMSTPQRRKRATTVTIVAHYNNVLASYDVW